MNPIAYRFNPKEPLHFLLIGKVVYYRGSGESERIWLLNFYSSAKTRRIVAKKMKRESSDVIFVEWDITGEEIMKQGQMFFPVASEKVSLYSKIEVFGELNRRHKD